MGKPKYKKKKLKCTWVDGKCVRGKKGSRKPKGQGWGTKNPKNTRPDTPLPESKLVKVEEHIMKYENPRFL